MRLDKKEFMINNMAVIDPMPNMRNSEVSKFEKDLIEKYIFEIFKKNPENDLEIELIKSDFFFMFQSIFWLEE